MKIPELLAKYRELLKEHKDECPESHEFYKFDDFAKLIRAVECLSGALKGLLNDSQHSSHNCGEAGCPVDNAREALAQAEEILK